MSANTKIEWATHTLNPWIGCTKISPGCDGCYAEAMMDKRMHKVQWGAGNPRVRTSAANWNMPLKWNANHEAFFAANGHRQRVFCASLADVFDNAVPQLWRTALFALIYDTPNLDWLLLTKRIGNAAAMLRADPPEGINMASLPNLWIGATIVTQEEADRDIPKLLAVPAAKRFLSMEPLLEHVTVFDLDGPIDVPDGMESPLHWVIVGGESGPGARPMHPDWARSLRDQCEAAGVPFLFKQWGEWKPISQMDESEHSALYRPKVTAKPHEDQGNLNDIYGQRCTVPNTIVHADGSVHEITEPMAFLQGTEAMQIFRVGKKAAGRMLDGRTWDGVPS